MKRESEIDILQVRTLQDQNLVGLFTIVIKFILARSKKTVQVYNLLLKS
jgi:hypothetical protein